MLNNNFFMNMEFGPNKDKNLASTLMGIAVKSDNGWRIYDKDKNEIIDVGDVLLGTLPIFILPTTNINEGDLIKSAGEYYFVVKIKKEGTECLCAKTGELKLIVPTKNILGFGCYSKVVAPLTDSIEENNEDIDLKKLAIISMCSQPNNSCNNVQQLFPLIFLKDKLGGEKEDIIKMMIISSMMTSTAISSNDSYYDDDSYDSEEDEEDDDILPF